ncbi:MAG TPA: ATP-binding protein [Phycisphaerales bacterium]|nr:ATP-binding protein [Phycisphaerales bacterium]
MHVDSGTPRQRATYVFWSILILLIAAAVGEGLAWSRQARLEAKRSDIIETMLALRTMRENVNAAAHARTVGVLRDAVITRSLREVAEPQLSDLDQRKVRYPTLAEDLAKIRASLDRADQAVPLPAASPDHLRSLENSEAGLGDLLATISAARDRLFAIYQQVSQEFAHGGGFFQSFAIIVIILAIGGMFLGALLIRRENRRRDQVEQQLRDSERRLERAEEIAHIGYWMNVRRADTISGSAEYFRIYGLEPAPSIPTQAIFSRIHPADIPAITKVHEQLLRDPAPRTLEYRIIRDGQVRHLVAHVIAHVAPDGTLLSTFGTVQDVTEHRLAQAEARAWRARFDAAVRAARQIVYERSVDTGAIHWEGALSETLGLTHADIQTLTLWRSRIHPDDLDRFDAELERSSSSQTPFALEYRVRHSEGPYRHILDRSHAYTPEDDAAKVVGLVIDLSDRKRLEDELLQAQKLESVGRLAGGVAHDLNNWLTAILGFADLARTDPNPDNLPGYIDRIERAGESAAKMTSQLLAFARRKVIELRVCSLADVARDAELLLRPLLGENIRLHITGAPELWHVHVDPVQFEQVIVNLAINARDAMPDGGRLTIETQNVVLSEDYAKTHPEVTPGQHVMLAISDTGVGIPPDQLQRIFEPFYTTKPMGTGTGLGLATVLGLVKQHGGHIWVYSEPGKGTTFKIYIPRYHGAKQANVPAPAAPLRTRGAETLLVVEDETLVRQLAVAALIDHGYDVLEAPSAEAALEYILHDPRHIHLVVTDVIMPGMSGKQIAAAVARTRPDTRVLYTSGYTDNVVVHHGILDEDIHFLQKPYTPAILAAKVREVLD